MIRRNKILLGSVLALAVAAIIISVSALPINSSNGRTIKAEVIKDCSATPWFIAEQKGYFTNAGIDFRDLGSLDWSLQATALISWSDRCL